MVVVDKEFLELIYKATFCENLEVPSALYNELNAFITKVLKHQLPKNIREELEFLQKATKLASTIKDKRKLLIYIQTDKVHLREKAKHFVNTCKLGLKERDKVLKSLQEYLDVYVLLEQIDEISQDLNRVSVKRTRDLKELLDRLKNIQQKISYEVLSKFSKDEKEVIVGPQTSVYELRRFSQHLESKFNLPGFKALEDFKLLGVGLTLIAGPTNHGKTTLMSGITAETFKGLVNAIKLLDTILQENKDITTEKLEELILTKYNGTDLKDFWPLIKTHFDVLTDESKRFGVIFISLEEDEISIFAKVLSNILDIPRQNLKSFTSDELISLFSQYIHPKVELRIKYVPSLTKIADIELYLANLESTGIVPVLLVVDYLDKLQSPLHTDNYRLNLITITYALRDIAILRNIPVLTATQLNREGLKSDKKLDLDTVAEAFGKTWEADVVCLFRQKESYPETGKALVEFLLAKSRYTMRGLHKELLVDLSRSKVETPSSILHDNNEIQNSMQNSNIIEAGDMDNLFE